jgi:hypothetical protein
MMAIARRVLAYRRGGYETLVVAGVEIDPADPLDMEGESVLRLDLRAAVAQLSVRRGRVVLDELSHVLVSRPCFDGRMVLGRHWPMLP